jgi:hypothetical protein
MDAAVKQRVKIDREMFIRSIDPLKICQLASSYNDGEPCNIFEDPIARSFNIYYTMVSRRGAI